jgi:hypothetical protein
VNDENKSDFEKALGLLKAENEANRKILADQLKGLEIEFESNNS